MGPAIIIGLGVIWWLLDRTPGSNGDDDDNDDDNDDTPTDPNMNPDGSCKDGYTLNSSGVCVPGGVVEFTNIERWSGEYSATGPGGDQVVWFYETGIRLADGTETYDPVKIVIGNANHTAFLSASTGGITIDNNDHVQTFSSLAVATTKADELANPTGSGNADGVVGGIESGADVEEFVAEKDTFVEGGFVDYGQQNKINVTDLSSGLGS
tara:strand:+ start:4585 stop:5214 length:630 start_codon:yes stop_codon:yes gene_type:complete